MRGKRDIVDDWMNISLNHYLLHPLANLFCILELVHFWKYENVVFVITSQCHSYYMLPNSRIRQEHRTSCILEKKNHPALLYKNDTLGLLAMGQAEPIRHTRRLMSHVQGTCVLVLFSLFARAACVKKIDQRRYKGVTRGQGRCFCVPMHNSSRVFTLHWSRRLGLKTWQWNISTASWILFMLIYLVVYCIYFFLQHVHFFVH